MLKFTIIEIFVTNRRDPAKVGHILKTRTRLNSKPETMYTIWSVLHNIVFHLNIPPILKYINSATYPPGQLKQKSSQLPFSLIIYSSSLYSPTENLTKIPLNYKGDWLQHFSCLCFLFIYFSFWLSPSLPLLINFSQPDPYSSRERTFSSCADLQACSVCLTFRIGFTEVGFFGEDEVSILMPFSSSCVPSRLWFFCCPWNAFLMIISE